VSLQHSATRSASTWVLLDARETRCSAVFAGVGRASASQVVGGRRPGLRASAKFEQLLGGELVRLTAVMASVAMVTLGTNAAPNDTIGLFFEPDCSKCSTTLAPGAETTLYINAIRGGPFGNYPLIGAELRVIGLPAGWSAACTPNPASLIDLGNPFGDGADIAFDSAPQTGSCVNLYTCEISATTSVQDVYLEVVAHATPGWPVGACPVVICDSGRQPFECMSCAQGMRAIINGPDCSVGVKPSPWSRIKSWYR